MSKQNLFPLYVREYKSPSIVARILGRVIYRDKDQRILRYKGCYYLY